MTKIFDVHFFRLSFIHSKVDIINIIKTLVVDRRGSVNAGRKIMRVYQDATGYSQKAIEKLKQIGVEIEEEDEPTRTRKTTTTQAAFARGH